MAEPFDIDNWSPVTVGPTWAKTEDGQSYVLPEHTVGWEALKWCAKWLKNPDTGKPWQFTAEQARFILWLYAVDETGQSTYRRSVLQRLKGAGKDPLAAALAWFECCGPCRFSHFDESGEVVGRELPAAWVQLVAVSLTQTKNTSRFMNSMITDAAIAHYDIDLGQEVIYSHGRKRQIQSVTSSFRALEGARVTFVVKNEALAIDTPIPTPSGWTTMGDLVDGDVIYGSDGKPTTVTRAHEVQYGRNAYRVTVSNGASVVASDGHLWETRIAASSAKPRVRTTQEMVDDGRRFMIPRAGIQESPEIDLPLDPYVLGAWLGDGSTGACNVTASDTDIDAMMGEFAKRGVDTHKLRQGVDRAARFSFSEKRGFGADMGGPAARALRALPCFRHKHVPEAYFGAGTEQRLELLRGLMDSDGCVSGKTGIFVGNERLSADVFRLASSLGLLPHRYFVKDERSRQGGSWRVQFQTEGLNPFSLPRKAERVQVLPRRKWVSVEIEAVESVPVRCISVDAEDSLFQAGDGIVTHNTHHWVSGNGGHEMSETIAGNVAKIEDARSLDITNAYMPGEDSVAQRIREGYERTQQGLAADFDLLYDSLEAPPNAPLEPEAMERVVSVIRGDAFWVNPKNAVSFALSSEILPARARRMFYNQIVAEEDQIYTPQDIQGARVERAYLEPGDEIVLGFDGGKTDDATALVAIRLSDRVAFPIGIWERPNGKQDWFINRPQVDSAVHDTFARYEVRAFFADVTLWESYIEQWSELYGPQLAVRASPDSAVGWDMSSAKRTTRRHESLVSALKNGRVKHSGDPLFMQHIANVRRRVNQYGLSFGKESRESRKKIDAYAALLAAHAAMTQYIERGSTPKSTAPSEWWAF